MLEADLQVKLEAQDTSDLADILRDIWVEDAKRHDINDLDKSDIISGILEHVKEGRDNGHWTYESWASVLD